MGVINYNVVMNGIVIIDKPKGLTSRDVVNIVSKKFNTKKVGHTGTLDPLATGVLVVAVNKATKLVDLLTSSDKEYVAECVFGVSTDTLDSEGNVLSTEDAIISEYDIINVLNSFKGTYNQEVPAYSAVKINGKKLYEYARENIEVKLPSREVNIYDIKLIDKPIYQDNHTKITFRVNVSKGTYIRSLIRDIAKKLNTVGIMTNLRRIKQGKFNIEDAVKLDSLTTDNIIPIKDVLGIRCVELTDEIIKKVVNGAKINNVYSDDKILFMKDNREIAIYKKDGNYMKIDKMIGGII